MGRMAQVDDTSAYRVARSIASCRTHLPGNATTFMLNGRKSFTFETKHTLPNVGIVKPGKSRKHVAGCSQGRKAVAD
jgi:hypothetical protein